jgi:hypothetical protein
MLATRLSGPLGNSQKSSLIETPETFASMRSHGDVPFLRYARRAELMTHQ